MRGSSTLFVAVAIFTITLASYCCCAEDSTRSDTAEVIRSIALHKINALNDRDCDRMAALYADDAMTLDPTTKPVIGRELIRGQCKGFLEMMEHFNVEISRVYTNTNPHQAVLQWLWVGLTSSGCLFHLEGVTHMQFDSEFRIEKESDFYDASMMQQRIYCSPERLQGLPAGEKLEQLTQSKRPQQLGSVREIPRIQGRSNPLDDDVE